MPTQIKINLCFNSVLGMTLNCIRWGSFGLGTEWCYPLPSLHPGPLWPRVVQPVRAPIKGTSWPASARSFGLDSTLGERKHRIQTSGKSNRKSPNTSFFLRTKTWGRIQRDKRWRWSASKEECHFLLTQWNHSIPSSRKATANHQTHHFSCGRKPSHLRSHSTRRKMTMIVPWAPVDYKIRSMAS